MFSCNSLYLTRFLPEELVFYVRVSKSVTFVTLVRKAADEKIIVAYFKILRRKELNEFVVKSNNIAGLVTSGLGPDVASVPPVGPP
jgi:hypothetical protein